MHNPDSRQFADRTSPVAIASHMIATLFPAPATPAPPGPSAIVRRLLIATMSSALSCRMRNRVLRAMGMPLAPDAKISMGTRLGGLNIVAASGFGANEGCRIDDYVRFGMNVRLGPEVKIITRSHPVGGPIQRRGEADTLRPVVIGNGAWIQTGAMILPGAHVAPGCIIMAGAVVTKPTAPDGVYAGVPAVRIGDAEAMR